MSMKKFGYFKKTLCISAILIGCVGLGPGWFEDDHRWRAPEPILTKATHTLKQNWFHELGIGAQKYFSRLTAAFAQDKLFVPDREGALYAIDLKTGQLLWIRERFSGSSRLTGSGFLTGGLTVAGGRMFLGSEDGKLFCLDSQDGALLWSVDTQSGILSKPVVGEDAVFVYTQQGALQARDTKTGALKWTADVQRPSEPSLRGAPIPFILEGASILMQEFQNHLVFFDVHTGARHRPAISLATQQLPKGGIFALPKVMHTSPLCIGNRVYTSEYQGKLRGFSIEDGDELEVLFERPISTFQELAWLDDKLFLVDEQDGVLAVNRETGAILWKNNSLAGRGLSAPVLYQGMLVLGDSQGFVYGFDPNTGKLVWKHFTRSSGIVQPPIVWEKDLLIVTRDGGVYSYTLQPI